MTPPSPVHDVRVPGTHRVVHLDRRRLMLLGTAGVFLGVAVIFGALAYFHISSPTFGAQHVSVPVTVTMPVHSAEASPSGSSPAPTPVVTVTTTQVVAVPPPAGGLNLGAIEGLASTLATVVAAACAVIALRPQRRTPPPTATASGAPAGTTSS